MRYVMSFLAPAIFLLIYPGICISGTWAHSFGNGTDDYFASSLLSTSDGGSIVGGSILIEPNPQVSYSDAYLLKLDRSGTPMWAVQAQSSSSRINWAEQTTDGGYITAGEISSFQNNYPWIMKLRSGGSTDWQKSFSTGSITVIHQIANGGYLIAGSIHDTSGYQVWLADLDTHGDLLWQKQYSDGAHEVLASMQLTADGGCLLGINLYDISFAHVGFAIIRTDSEGHIVWQRVSAATANEFQGLTCVAPTADGGFIASGWSDDFPKQNGWLLKGDFSGKPQWRKEYGDAFYQAQQTTDGGYLLSGSSLSNNNDQWIVKTDSSGASLWQKIYRTGAGPVLIKADGYLVAGVKSSYLYGEHTPDQTAAPPEVSGKRGRVLKEGTVGREIMLLSLDVAGNYPFCLDDISIPFTESNRSLQDGAFSTRHASAAPVEFSVTLQQVAPSIYDELLLCDNFDAGILSPRWAARKGVWSQEQGSLKGTPSNAKTDIFYSGLQNTQTLVVSADLQTSGGPKSSVSLLVWYQDSSNYAELVMDQVHGRWIFRRKAGGKFVAQDLEIGVLIEPNIKYRVFVVFVSRNEPGIVASAGGYYLTIPLPKDASLQGTVGFRVRGATASFDSIEVTGLPGN